MPVAAIASAVATVGSAVIGSSAAKSAANTQATAANHATDIQQQMYGQTRSDLQPFRDLGSAAGGKLSDLLGLSGKTGPAAPVLGGSNFAGYVQNNPDLLAYWNSHPDVQAQFNGDMGAWGQSHYASSGQAEGRALPTFNQNDVASFRTPQDQALETLPGYTFTRDQGIASVNRVLGSQGQTGAQAKGIARFVTGLADSTYNGQVANLKGVVDTGENAAAQTGVIGANYGGNIGNNIVGAGTASAAGTVGAANALSGGLSSIPSYLLINKILGSGGGGGSAGIYGSAYNGANVDPAALGG